MKRTLTTLLSLCLLFCLTACGTTDTISNNVSDDALQTGITSSKSDEKESNSETDSSAEIDSNSYVKETSTPLTEEQIRKIVEEEIVKNGQNSSVNVNEVTTAVLNTIEQKNKFRVGDTVLNPIGNNFKMPINNQSGDFATITSINVTKEKEANINNLDDYFKSSAGYDTYHYYYRYIYRIKISGKVDEKFAGNKISINLQWENDTVFLEEDKKPIINSDGTFQYDCLAYSNRNETVIIPDSIHINMF